MSHRNHPLARRRSAAAALIVTLVAADLSAYEADQYSNRLVPIADSTAVLNDHVNRVLEELARGWKHGHNEKRFARAVYWRLGNWHWIDKVERFANRSPEVEKLPRRGKRGIYGGLPIWATRFAGLFGTAHTIRVNGVLIGADKLGHFVSQGRKYYRRYRRGNPPERVLRLGVRNEQGLFGATTTGVFSNGDLVANYEGYLFYRGLFEDGFVAGKPALIGWDSEKPYLNRRFDWADHVNEFWDEALLPSRYGRRLQKHVARKLEELCPEYLSSPGSYVPRRYDELMARYARLGLREATYNRMDRVCAGDDGSP